MPPVRLVFSGAWRALTSLTGFYWRHRRALWQSFVDLLEASEASSQRQFEIRLTADREYKTARAFDSAWEVELADGCVFCGVPVADDAIKEEREVSDLTRPFWSFPASLVVGLAVGLLTWFFWAIPIAMVVGLVLGYLARKSTAVRLQFRRCESHASDKRLPTTRVFGDLLVIGVGCKEVRHQFLVANNSGTRAIRADD